MVESFFKEDDTAEARKCAWSGEEKLTESASVGLDVLYVDARETFSDCAG